VSLVRAQVGEPYFSRKSFESFLIRLWHLPRPSSLWWGFFYGRFFV